MVYAPLIDYGRSLSLFPASSHNQSLKRELRERNAILFDLSSQVTSTRKFALVRSSGHANTQEPTSNA